VVVVVVVVVVVQLLLLPLLLPLVFSYYDRLVVAYTLQQVVFILVLIRMYLSLCRSDVKL
jgi:hypothetical protein